MNYNLLINNYSSICQNKIRV